WGLAVAEAAVDGPVEVAVVGSPGDDARGRLHEAALLSSRPGAVIAVGAPGAADVPLLEQRGLVDDSAAAYVCQNLTCQRPVTDVAELRRTLAA
ncbi:MAG: N-acylglucosamine 2-epimerase, partial [Streptosporangiales bacterium]